MNNFEKACKALTDVVNSNPERVKKPMSRQEVISIYHEVYPELNGGNCSPSDICWNRANGQQMTKDFQHWPHALEYIDGDYKVLGSDVNYTGTVYWKHKGDTQDSVFGTYINGTFHEGDESMLVNISDSVLRRRMDLAEGIKNELRDIPVSIETDSNKVLVMFQELLICGSVIEDEGYRIFNASSDWADVTTYLCEEAEDGTWFYYLESIDECISEMHRLVMFEAKKGKKQPATTGTHTSELSRIVTADVFEKSYRRFIENADQYTEQGTTRGSSQVPYGFSSKPDCDGAQFSAHFGQGGVSATPYMNWWVVSIYYLPANGNIIMGIEEDRYPHLKKMEVKPLRYSQVGNKKINMAVYYSSSKDTVNYKELYDKFIQVCEEVMRLGLD